MAKCPHCDKGISVDANLMAEETITVRMTYQGDWLDAGAVVDIIRAVDNSVKETARCLGSTKTEVFCTHLAIGGGEFAVDLLVMTKDKGVAAADIAEVVSDTVAYFASNPEA